MTNAASEETDVSTLINTDTIYWNLSLRNVKTYFEFWSSEKAFVRVALPKVPDVPEDDAAESRVGKECSDSVLQPIGAHHLIRPAQIEFRHEEL